MIASLAVASPIITQPFSIARFAFQPEDIYKSHLSETGGFSRRQQTNSKVDSARANLASTFVNAFVNAGFNTDKLLTVENSDWLYKNKEHGMLSATASLGLLMLWNVEEGLTVIDKYLYSNEEMVKAGAVLGGEKLAKLKQLILILK